MQPSMPAGDVFSAVAARLGAGGDVSSPGPGGIGGWVFPVATALAVLVVGGFAARLAHRLVRRSTSELIVLLDQSASFYSRWPEDRLASAPRGELMAEAARCRRTIQLLESRSAAVIASEPASRGPIDGLKAWTALLHKQIEGHANTPSGLAHA